MPIFYMDIFGIVPSRPNIILTLKLKAGKRKMIGLLNIFVKVIFKNYLANKFIAISLAK